MNRHKLIVDERVVRKDYDSTKHLPAEKALKYQLFYQMTRLTREKGSLAHDDRLDVLAMAVQYWVEQMSRDVDDAIQTHRSEKLIEELERFTDHALGGSPRNSMTWMSNSSESRWMTS